MDAPDQADAAATAPLLSVVTPTYNEAENLPILLSELHQSTLLQALRRRYMEDVVYTYIGPIVIALNPFNYNIPWHAARPFRIHRLRSPFEGRL